MKVLVTGASGVLGRAVTSDVQARGHEVIPASRSAQPPIDITKPISIDADLTIHCATNLAKAQRVEVDSLQRLPGRVVYPSIVACDTIHFPYYKVKVAAEKALDDHPDHAIVRLTQFHEFAERLAQLPIPVVPRHFRTQSIAVSEAATALVDVALSDHQGRTADVGGPETHDLAEQVRAVRARLGRSQLVMRPYMPGSRGFRAGHNLHAPKVGRITWAEHLASLGSGDP